jgi:hypothetical protein
MAHFDAQVWPTCQDDLRVRERDPAVVDLLGRGRGGTPSLWKRTRLWITETGGSSWSGNEIGKCDGFVAVRATSAWADPFAKPLAVRAALLAEVARLTFRAHVHGGEPRHACRDERLRRVGVTTSPCRLTARCVAETLSTNTFERCSANSAAVRLGIVTQRLHPDLACGYGDAARVCGENGTTRSRSR